MVKFNSGYFAVILISFLFGKTIGEFADFHFTGEPKDTIVIKGNSATLDCAVSGDRSSEIRWKREGVDVVLSKSEDRRRILSNGSLFFEKVYHTRTERPDEGRYQCLATSEGVGTIISRSAKLQIASLPKFDVQHANLTMLMGQTAYFPCTVLAVPVGSVSWLKDEHPLRFDNSRMTVLPSGALEIDHIEKSDSGLYRCNASNIEKFRLSDAARLYVDSNFDASKLVSAPTFVASPPKVSSVLEGQSLTLDCAAIGNPKPQIVWLKDESTIDMADLDSKFRIVGIGSLHIEKIKEDDSGTYMCRAENKEDSVDTQASVIVHVPPRFDKRPQNRYAYEKEDIELQCEVYGRPLPTVQWFRDGSSLIASEYYQYVKNNLRILGLVKSDAGMYQCIASNQAGNIQASLQLIVRDLDSNSFTLTTTATTLSSSSVAAAVIFPNIVGPFSSKDTPSAPRNVSAVILSTRFLTLKWTPPLRSNGDIFAYSVFYREKSSTRERTVNTTSVHLEEMIIQGLLPSTTYIFRVVAYNKHGPGQFSENLTVETGSEVKVPSLPLKLEAYALSATSIHVQWHPPNGDSEFIHQYTVHYLEDGIEDGQETSTSNTSVILTDLNKFTEYTIWVTATNHFGIGQSTEEVTARTFTDVPSDTPHNVTLEAASSSSIIVRWEPPPKESQNGMITGYKIRYKIKAKRTDSGTSEGSKRAESVTTDGSRRLYMLTDLERGSQYMVKMSALTFNGSGPATEWMIAETRVNDLSEHKVPDAPGALRSRASSTSIILNWDPPRNPNIMVGGYTIGWGIGIPDVYNEVLDGKQRYYKISDLTPSLEYVISVRAFNQLGPSIPIYDTVKTQAEATLEPMSAMMPPVGLRAIVLSPTTVVLYWTDNTLSHNQIINDNRYYTIRYSITSKYKYFNSTELNCMVDDLKPNTLYDFSVKVVKGRRESTWSMSVQNTTQESVPSSPPRDLTVVPSEDDSTQVHIHWQPPKQPNGNIIGYVISFSTVAPQKNVAVEDREWTLQDSIGDKLTAIFKGISKNSVYYFKIQAKNSKGYGPFSSEISFRTAAEMKSSNDTLYIIIACVSGVTFIILLIIVIVACRRRRRAAKRNKSYAKSTLAKNKAMAKEIVPPDLWIHHDQMELKPVDKTCCAENNMTLTPIQRNSQELGEEPLLSCMEKKKSAYLDSIDDSTKFLDNCIVKCQIRATPIKIPLDVQKPLLSNCNTSTVPLPSGLPGQSSDVGGSTLSRPMYPRTQYNISRTHNSGELCHSGSIVDVNVPPVPLNIHVTSGPLHSSIASEKCHAFPPPMSAAPHVTEPQSGTLTKRPPGHALRSFTVPAPPPQSAPATPQPKHLDMCTPKIQSQHAQASTSVAHLQQNNGLTSSITPKVQAEGSVHKGPAGSVQVSWSTEKLNQEVANLEGLMKDLNAIRASEFEC